MHVVIDPALVATPVDEFIYAMQQRGCVVTMSFNDDNKFVITIEPSRETLQQL